MVSTPRAGSNWVQYGNVYCYDIDPEQSNTTRNGDFKISGGEKVEINGDVFVEGNLVIGSGCEFKCRNLTVCGTVTGTPTVSGTTKTGSSATLEKVRQRLSSYNGIYIRGL